MKSSLFLPLAISSGYTVSTKTQVCIAMCIYTRTHSGMHTPTACMLTQTLCADSSKSLFFFSCLQTDSLRLSSGQSGYEERRSSYERWAIYKLILHTKPTDQKHSFGSFSPSGCLSKRYEVMKVRQKREGKYFAAESNPNWLVVEMTNVKLHQLWKARRWEPTTCLLVRTSPSFKNGWCGRPGP